MITTPKMAWNSSGMKDEDPLDHRQNLAEAVNRVDVSLKRGGTIQHAGVGQQMDDHVRADRNQAGQRMQPANQELMTRS